MSSFRGKLHFKTNSYSSTSTARLAQRGLKPIHSRATANARRLGKRQRTAAGSVSHTNCAFCVVADVALMRSLRTESFRRALPIARSSFDYASRRRRIRGHRECHPITRTARQIGGRWRGSGRQFRGGVHTLHPRRDGHLGQGGESHRLAAGVKAGRLSKLKEQTRLYNRV